MMPSWPTAHTLASIAVIAVNVERVGTCACFQVVASFEYTISRDADRNVAITRFRDGELQGIRTSGMTSAGESTGSVHACAYTLASAQAIAHRIDIRSRIFQTPEMRQPLESG